MANAGLHGRTLASRLAALGRVPLWLPVVVAPLLAGTAERPYTLVLAGLCGLAVLWAAVRAGRRGTVLHGSWFAGALFLAALASLVQCVPLPPALRAVLAPGSEATLRELLQALGAPSQALPLSVDPAATGNEVVRLLGYLSLLLALGTALRRRGDRRRLGRVICGGASLVAGLGALAALGVPLPAWCAVPAEGATRALLPAAFYNSNHLAALLAAGAIVTVGAVLDAASRGERTLLGLLLALQDLALLGTLSRAGIIIGLGGQLVVLVRGRGTRWRAGWRGLVLLGGPLLGAALFVVASPGWLGGLKQRFFALSGAALLAEGGKLHAWRDALPLLRGHWAFGVGRGAFEDAFASYHRLGGATRFVYLENTALQALVDWGVPLALGLGGLVALGLREAFWGLGQSPRPSAENTTGDASSSAGAGTGRRASVRRAALVAFLGLLLHNLVDFSLEVGGVAVVAVALAALIERPRFTLRPRWGVVLAVVTLCGTAAVWRFCPTHDEDGARLRELAESSVHSPAEVVAAGTQAALRHPLDSYLYATVAARLWHAQRPEAVTWVNRALVANPRDLGARRTSALILAQYGHREQALRTLALALPDASRAQRLWLYRTALGLSPSAAELLTFLPAPEDWLPADLPLGLFADELLEQLGASSPPPWPLVRTVAEWGRPRGSREALTWLGRAALAQRDAASAGALLGELKRAGASPLLLADLLTVLIEAGKLDDAARLAATELADLRAPAVLLARALLQERRGQLAAARDLLDTAQTAADQRELRARVHEARAELETRAGNLHRAALERQAAAAELLP